MSKREPDYSAGFSPPHAPMHAHELPYEPPHESVESDREIQYRQLVWMGVGLLVIAVISAVVVFFMLKGFVSWRAATAEAPPPVMPPPAESAGPQLLARPENALTEMRQGEKEILEGYGWLDPKSGVAHIPIERAMAIVARRGLPARGAAPPPASPAIAPPGAAPGSPPTAAASAGAPPASTAGATTAPSPSPPPGGPR